LALELALELEPDLTLELALELEPDLALELEQEPDLALEPGLEPERALPRLLAERLAGRSGWSQRRTRRHRSSSPVPEAWDARGGSAADRGSRARRPRRGSRDGRR
jgi:hypothetical protein